VRKFNRCVAIVLVVLLIGMTFDVPSFFHIGFNKSMLRRNKLIPVNRLQNQYTKKLILMMIYRWTLNHRSHLPIFS